MELQQILNVYNKVRSKDISDQDSLHKTMKSTIQKAIENALKSGTDVKAIRTQILYLCRDAFAIPTDLHDWAVTEIEKVLESEEKDEVSIPPCLPSKEEKQPLCLTKDILYHASLCCQAVSTCDTHTFKPFLNRTGHTLNEVSMSILRDKENVDRYIIAKQGNIVYMAFQSESTLSKWIDGPYGSFSDGI